MAGYSATFTVVDNATKQIDAINKRIAAMRAPMDRMSRSVSKFVDVSGLRRVADGFNWIGRAAATALKPLMAMVPVLGTITGAATIAGMVRLVSSFAAWGRQMEVNADRIGVSTGELQKYQDALRLAGGNAEDMTSSLTGLTDSIKDASITAGDARAWFNRWGISIYDTNGKLRSATDLLPEVIQHLNEIPNPAQRAAVANQILGGSGEKLIETFRTSGRSFGDWINQAAKLPQVTKDQRDALLAFQSAQASLGVTFDHLGQQVAGVLAKNFVPLMQKVDQFVQQHTPEIIAAVDRISAKFAAWLQGIDWGKVEQGLDALVKSLTWVANNLDTIKIAAETIAGIFMVKWAVGIVTAITQVATALGTVGSGAASMAAGAGGAGLLGALSAVAGLAAGLAVIGATYAGNKGINQRIDEEAAKLGYTKQGGGWLNPIPTYKNPVTGESVSYADMQKRLGAGPEGFTPWGKGPSAENFKSRQDFLDRIGPLAAKASQETGVDPRIIEAQAAVETGWGQHAPQNNYFGIKGPGGTLMTREVINGQSVMVPQNFAGYGSLEESVKGYADFINKNRNYTALKQGGTLEQQAANLQASGYATAPNYGTTVLGIAKALPVPSAPAVQLNQPSTPANGRVDISVSHINPPPGVSLGASASGDGVNLEPPRTERLGLAGP